MRRLIALGAVALFVLAVAVPLTSAGATPVTRHVDGSITVLEPGDRLWIAKFEVGTRSPRHRRPVSPARTSSPTAA